MAHGEPFDGSALQGRGPRSRSRHAARGPTRRPCVDRRRPRPGGRARCSRRDGHPWPGDPRTALARLVIEQRRRAGVGVDVDRPSSSSTCSTPTAPASTAAAYFDDHDGRGRVDRPRGGRRALRRTASRSSPATTRPVPASTRSTSAPLGPLALADALVLAKQIVREVAAEAGVLATFMARPLEGEAGSGLHLTSSRRRPGRGRRQSLTRSGSAFVAGLLDPRPGAAPRWRRRRSTPTSGSTPGRRRPARRCGPTSTGRRWCASATGGIEYRGADPAANPYLLMAGSAGRRRRRDGQRPRSRTARWRRLSTASTRRTPTPCATSRCPAASTRRSTRCSPTTCSSTPSTRSCRALVDGRRGGGRGLPTPRHLVGAGALPHAELRSGDIRRGQRRSATVEGGGALLDERLRRLEVVLGLAAVLSGGWPPWSMHSTSSPSTARLRLSLM